METGLKVERKPNGIGLTQSVVVVVHQHSQEHNTRPFSPLPTAKSNQLITTLRFRFRRRFQAATILVSIDIASLQKPHKPNQTKPHLITFIISYILFNNVPIHNRIGKENHYIIRSFKFNLKSTTILATNHFAYIVSFLLGNGGYDVNVGVQVCQLAFCSFCSKHPLLYFT